MKRLGFLLASIFISPEMMAALALYFAYVYFPGTYSFIGERLVSNTDVWSYLPTLTLLLSGFAFQQSFKLRAPLSSGNKVLYEWPAYLYLVDRVYVCLAIATLSAATAISLWVFGATMAPKTVALIFLLGSIVSGITALTMLLAHQKIVEILELYANSSDKRQRREVGRDA